MSKVQIMAVGAGVLMLAFYLNKRKELADRAPAGTFFDGYGYVPRNVSYNYR